MGETQVSFSQRIIKEELIDEILDTCDETDPLALSDDQKEEIVTNEYNKEVKNIYVKEEPELEECVKKENDNIYNSYEYNDFDDSKRSIDIKENIITCPEENNDVTNTSLFEDGVHNNDHHRKGKTLKTGKEKTIICEECKKQFSKACYLKVHIRDVHRESNTQCQVCNKILSTHRYLKVHIKTIHLGIKDYKCQLCDNFFTEASGLRAHIKTMHDGIKFSCKQCNKKFSASSSLKSHIITKHDKDRYKNYECEICKKTFSKLCHLKSHIIIVHQRLKKFECELCSKRFGEFKTLKKHISVLHKASKCFKCVECKKIFHCFQRLKDHIRTERFEKHKRLHGKQKNCKNSKETNVYEYCELCQKSFLLYKMHMFMMHGKYTP